MISFSLEPESATLVLVSQGGGATSGETLDELLDAVGHMSRRAGTGVLAILAIAEPGSSLPETFWRRRRAEKKRATRAYRTAVVTRDVLPRGALLAIDGVRPPTSEQKTRAFATVEEASAWLEGECHRRLDALPRLIDKASRAA